MDYLTIIASDGRTFRRDLDADVVRVGRSSKNDINLSFDLSLSRFHAEVTRRGGRFYVTDVGSRNGTSLNGKPVQEPAELRPGDRITLGETTMLFSSEAGQSVAIEDSPATLSDTSTVSIPLEDLIGAPPPGRKANAAAGGDPGHESRTLTVLTRAGMELINYRPLDEVLDVIMDLVFEATPAERGFLMLREGEHKDLVSKVVRDLKKRAGTKLTLSRSIATTVVENRQSVLTSDAQSDERFQMKESIVLQGIHSAMCVPLWNNREVIGLVYVDKLQATSVFTPEDLRLLTLLANIAAVKIENARLFETKVEQERMEKELRHAAEIQRKLLPVATPRYPGYDLAGFNSPCREVGGDYFDFITTAEGRLRFAIGDVSGKGMGAALLMATVRAAFRAHMESRHDLVQVMASLNETILQSASSNNFVSFFYGELEGATGRLTYVNAGHNPPVLVRGDGRVERLEPSGVILGVFTGAAYGQCEVALGRGDLLVAFSDGVTETHNEGGEEFGEPRLIGLLCERREAGAPEVQGLVQESLKTFAGREPQYDDVTLIVVRRGA